MNQELMTLDFGQDMVIYEGKTLPVGALACDALNVPADTSGCRLGYSENKQICNRSNSLSSEL